MSTAIERLRNEATLYGKPDDQMACDILDVCDENLALRVENERLREALRGVALCCGLENEWGRCEDHQRVRDLLDDGGRPQPVDNAAPE